MASLMENLLEILKKENSEYEILLELSKRKTPVIIKGDIVELQKITEEEQNVVGRINRIAANREQILADIANVINKDVKTLKLSNLIQLLVKQPKEQEVLSILHDSLKTTLGNMEKINNQNRELLKHSLEMIEFDLNLIQSLKQAPETADYNKGAYSMGNTIGANQGGFDARQ